MSSNEAQPPRARQPILYADQLWRQQRFFAGFLVAVGIGMTALLIYKGQLLQTTNLIWVAYIPSGLLLGGAFLVYKWRSYVEPLDDGLKVSALRSSVIIDYGDIRSVKVQPLKIAFQDNRKRMVAPMMRPLLERPALFVRLRNDEAALATIKKTLGARMVWEDTIAMPVKDADAVSWEISSRLPERLGQNQGGGRRRKRRR
ncbi:MAG: hypothetical protein E6J18_00165 [Chloroflexi bacterium]|nr:MAG: hypothetical protein E6J37_10335 [Chloroflexota bacterium]TMC74235.1 MAG: hypothetical protein E6J18_00165 [Chloroflexota bacterium]